MLRVGLPHLVAAALVMVVALLVVSSIDVEAKRYIVTDSFNSPDGSAPDVNKWVVEEDVYQDMVQITDGRLMTWSSASGHAYCTLARPFSNDNITLSVEFSVNEAADRAFDIALITGDGSNWSRLVSFKYEGGVWGWERQWEGDVERLHSTTSTLVLDRWYIAELDIYELNATFSVRERDGGSYVWNWNRLAIEPTEARNLVTFGVDMYAPGSSAKTFWDNLTLVDPVANSNQQPRWIPVPNLTAVEDVHVFHDFQRYIVDDQEPWELTLTSSSDYVIGVNGFEVEFLFPNNVTDVDVSIVVYDGYVSIPYPVHFDVTPVNDPPEENLPDTLSATEGIETTIHLEDYIWDVDNEPEDLQVLITSPYITIDGLKLVVTFLEGMTQYIVEIGITDGSELIVTDLYFIITPMNNPPIIGWIDDMDVTEDVPYDLDLIRLLSDPDDDIETLAITVTSDHAIIEGLVITFLYPEGGYSEEVWIGVSDGFSTAQRSFLIRILATNDPPVVADDIPNVEVYEDEETYITLSDWISDEDHPNSQLALTASHPNIIAILHLTIMVSYSDGGIFDMISFNVTDGEHETYGYIEIFVVEVNDPPEITGIGEQEGPYYFRLPSHAERHYQIYAADGDDRNLRYSVDTLWDGLWISHSQLVISTDREDSGDFSGYLNVYDNRGGHQRVKITAHVTLRENLPISLSITTPGNHSKHDPGDLLTFTINIRDPDGYIQGPTTVTWTSDLMGDLANQNLAHGGNLTTSELEEGRHIIYAEVSDGVITKRAWIVVDVGDVGTEPSSLTEDPLCTIGFLLIIILVMGVIVGFFVARAGKDIEPEPSPIRTGAAPSTRPVSPRDEKVAKDRLDMRERVARAQDSERAEAAAAKREDEARMARIRAQERVEDRRKAAHESMFMPKGEVERPQPPKPPITPTPRPTGTGGALPTEAEMDAMRTAIRDALGKVPGGLPSSLSLYDETTIAIRIIKGRKKWSEDGRLLAFVQGEWYYAHPNDKEFMRVY